MSDLVEFWDNKFPYGIEEFANCLSNKKRRAIVRLIFDEGKKSFSEIKEELNLENNTLSQHLNILVNNGFLKRTNSIWREDDKIFKSKYSLNEIYRNILKLNIYLLSSPYRKNERAIIQPELEIFFRGMTEIEHFENLDITKTHFKFTRKKVSTGVKI